MPSLQPAVESFRIPCCINEVLPPRESRCAHRPKPPTHLTAPDARRHARARPAFADDHDRQLLIASYDVHNPGCPAKRLAAQPRPPGALTAREVNTADTVLVVGRDRRLRRPAAKVLVVKLTPSAAQPAQRWWQMKRETTRKSSDRVAGHGQPMADFVKGAKVPKRRIASSCATGYRRIRDRPGSGRHAESRIAAMPDFPCIANQCSLPFSPRPPIEWLFNPQFNIGEDVEVWAGHHRCWACC